MIDVAGEVVRGRVASAAICDHRPYERDENQGSLPPHDCGESCSTDGRGYGKFGSTDEANEHCDAFIHSHTLRPEVQLRSIQCFDGDASVAFVLARNAEIINPAGEEAACGSSLKTPWTDGGTVATD